MLSSFTTNVFYDRHGNICSQIQKVKRKCVESIHKTSDESKIYEVAKLFNLEVK